MMKEMVYKPERLKNPEILYDGWEGLFRILILSIGQYPYAYVGLPKDHFLAGLDEEDLSFIQCHGGFTFSNEGDGKILPEDLWWYGWDYAHLGDWTGDLEETDLSYPESYGYRKWTTKEILQEAREVVRQMAKLMDVVHTIIENLSKRMQSDNEDKKGGSNAD